MTQYGQDGDSETPRIQDFLRSHSIWVADMPPTSILSTQTLTVQGTAVPLLDRGLGRETCLETLEEGPQIGQYMYGKSQPHGSGLASISRICTQKSHGKVLIPLHAISPTYTNPYTTVAAQEGRCSENPGQGRGGQRRERRQEERGFSDSP